LPDHFAESRGSCGPADPTIGQADSDEIDRFVDTATRVFLTVTLNKGEEPTEFGRRVVRYGAQLYPGKLDKLEH